MQQRRRPQADAVLYTRTQTPAAPSSGALLLQRYGVKGHRGEAGRGRSTDQPDPQTSSAGTPTDDRQPQAHPGDQRKHHGSVSANFQDVASLQKHWPQGFLSLWSLFFRMTNQASRQVQALGEA